MLSFKAEYCGYLKHSSKKRGWIIQINEMIFFPNCAEENELP